MTWRTDLPFAPVPLWVAQLPISDRAYRLYGTLAGLRDFDTGEASYGRKRLAEMLRCSLGSLDRAKAELEEHGAISVEQASNGNGGQGANVYVIYRVPPGDRHGRRGGSRTVEEGPSRTGDDPVQGDRTKKNQRSTTTRAREAPDQLQVQEVAGAKPRIAKVDGKKVTLREAGLAEAALVAFNDVFGKAFRADGYWKSIVMRVREHPELDEAAHRRLVEKALRNPWWKDDPTPAVVYGNTATFERTLNGREKAEDGMDAYTRA